MGSSTGQPTSPALPPTPAAPQAGLDFSGFSGANSMADQIGNTNFTPVEPSQMDSLSTTLTNQFDSGSVQAQLNKPEPSMMDKFKAGFGGEDAKKLAKDLAGANQQKAPQMTAVNTQASGAGGGQLPNYYAAMMGAPQPSGAMQAIQGSMPQMQQPMGIMGRI